MTKRLDLAIARLAAEPADWALDGFAAELARRIARRRGQGRVLGALAPVAAASVALALALGAAVGGVTAAASPVRPAPADLAPSTLLESAP